MKTEILFVITLVMAVLPTFAQDEFPYLSLNAALPLQATVCDVVGIGHALFQDETNVVFQIDQFWYGSVTNNSVVF